MSEGDVPDLASSSDSDSEENFTSNKPQNGFSEEVKSFAKLTDNGGTSMSVQDLLAKVGEKSKEAQKDQNSGDASDSASDNDDDDDEGSDDDDDNEDGNEKEDIVSRPDDAGSHCSANQEMEDAGSKSITLQQRQEEKFLSCLRQANLAFTSGSYLSAVSEYKLALMMLTNNNFESDHSEGYIIRYCLGLSQINLKGNKEIHEGEKFFQSIVEEGDPHFQVLGYLGLAKAYLKQNRFSDAIQPLQDGIALLSDGVFPGRCLWPGTLNVIAETDHSPADLKELFEQLLSDCRNPPLPVAVCRYSKCYDPVKTQMYLSDPEFKGYVQVECCEKCVMEYHRECWRDMKTKELDKRSDKELLSYSCITPDCQSTICRIWVYGSDGNTLRTLNIEENASKGKKPGAKNKNISMHVAKVPAPKKAGGKKAKGVPVVEEKAKGVEADDGSENKIRLGDIVRHRDDPRAHEGGGVGGGDGGGGRSGRHHRRKSIDAGGELGGHDDTRRRRLESESGVDPLVTVKRTDFVTLQRKRNEEQDSENQLSKKSKKKREKEKPKKTTISLDFVDERRKNNKEALEQAFAQAFDPNPHSLWTIPPHGAYGETSSDNWLMSQSNGSYGYASAEPLSGKQHSEGHDSWDLRTGTISSRSEPDSNSEVSRKSSASNDSRPSPEAEDDVKGNIMSYFEMFLEKNGPCLTEDDLIQRELEAFPGDAQLVISEAGGLANLLLQSVKFTVVDGFICLLKDAVKGRQKARERRMAMLSGSSFFKKFAGGQSAIKTNSSTVNTVTSSGGNTGSATVAPGPEADKASLISAAAKKSDDVISRAGPVAAMPQSDSTSTSDKISASNETAEHSSLQNPVVSRMGGAGESAVVSNDIKPSGKDKDSLFGLCDLNEYKNQLRQKNASSPVVNKYDGLDSFDFECEGNLSVIEKFKKQVHEAASKERNRARQAQAASSLASANETSDYSAKSLVGDSKYAASVGLFGNLSSTADGGFGSFLFTGNDVKIENDKKIKKSYESTGKIIEQPLPVSSLLDIEDDVENEKIADSINKTSKSDAGLYSFLGNGENVSKTSNASLKISPTVKSTLSATASNFHFPLFSTGYTFATGTVSSTAAQKVTPPSAGALGSRTSHGLHMNSLDYDFGTDLAPVTSAGIDENVHKSDSDLFEVFGSRHKDHNNLWVEDRAMNTDDCVIAYQDYECLKSDYDELSRKYRLLAEKQVHTQNRHAEELHIVSDKLRRATDQLESSETKAWQLESESQQWKREKMIYENELEKLRSELNYTKKSLDSANHLVEVTNRLLSETQNGLISEQEECRSVRDKYESLLNQLGRAVRGKVDRAEIPFAQPISGSSGALVPVMASDPVGRTAGNRKSKHGFEKILDMLALEFPNLSRIEMSRCVQEVRMSRNNSLSGLTVQEIVAKVREFILKEQTAKQLKKKNALDLSYSSPNMVKYNSNNNGTFGGGDVFQEEIDPCIICHEELSTEAASMLDCGHSFHTECVRKWFREQSTCPTCRNHALLPDEFPALGRTFYT